MSKKTPFIVAKCLIREIVQGDVALGEWLAHRINHNEILLLKGCICAGLNIATDVTTRGLHALGHLISISRIVNYGGDDGRVPKEQEQAFVTADALLTVLIGSFDTSHFEYAIRQLWSLGAPVVTHDAELIAALLSVREEDNYRIDEFVKILELTYIGYIDKSLEDRKDWDISADFGDSLRRKAVK